jgi:hypothetical protein
LPLFLPFLRICLDLHSGHCIKIILNSYLNYATPKNILLAEDNANDVELTLEALAEHNLANQVVVGPRWGRSTGLPLLPGKVRTALRG